jgi:adenylate cyclase
MVNSNLDIGKLYPLMSMGSLCYTHQYYRTISRFLHDRRKVMKEIPNDDLWYWYLTGETRGTYPEKYERYYEAYRRVYKLIPGDPRCFECYIPMAGFTGLLLRPWGSHPSSFSPRLCSKCENFARSSEAGAEVELTLLFADVRDSTPLAEKVGTSKFQELIKRFYQTTSDVLIEHNAMVNRLMGDQVSALFVPRFAGTDHAKVAIHAARELLRATGHEDPSGPWLPVGVSVHTGPAYVGVVGSKDGVNEIAVLGSAVNLAPRLSSQASTGEVLISDTAANSAELDTSGMISRLLNLKGISSPVAVTVIRSKPGI